MLLQRKAQFMPGLLIQFLGLLALIGGSIRGYRIWVRPHEKDLTFQGRGMLLLLIVTLMGGMIGGVAWWFDDPRAFSWDLPPLASRMLGAAGWSFGMITFMALTRPAYQRIRLALLMLFTYLAPLLIVIPLFHLNRFDPSAPITYAFFALVIGLTIPALWYLVKQPRILPNEPQMPPNATIQTWLLIVAVVMLLWSAALFITDQSFTDLIWVWPGDLLTSRLIGVMLLTLAVGALYSLRSADAASMLLNGIIVYGAGIVVAMLWNAFANKPIKLSYVVVFGLMAVISLILRRSVSKR
jgi:hypothetical protein